MQPYFRGDTLKSSRLRRDDEFDPKDMISRLPDELITRILESVPTKDGAVLGSTSKRMRGLFLWLTKLDFDDSPIYHCSTRPHLRERFPAFKTFVDAVLQASLSPKLDRFRLRLGGDSLKRARGCGVWGAPCKEVCFPDVSPSQLQPWMSFPLTRHGIREIDVCIHLSNHCMLPPALFTCETLEVLKLDVSLDLAQVLALPDFRLPNLKLLHIKLPVVILEDDLISRLVLSCPCLEELHVFARMKNGTSIAISSPSLRSLSLTIDDHRDSWRNIVLIDTPNLQHLTYSENLADCYSVSNMSALVQALFEVRHARGADEEACFRNMISLVKAASNVQDLGLHCKCFKILDHDMLNDCLPVFHNLIRLSVIDHMWNNFRWHTLLLGVDFDYLSHMEVQQRCVCYVKNSV